MSNIKKRISHGLIKEIGYKGVILNEVLDSWLKIYFHTYYYQGICKLENNIKCELCTYKCEQVKKGKTKRFPLARADL